MQLKLPVFADQLTNLSDARFFAAYGIDWLSFDCNPISNHYVKPAQIKEIMSWVSGPKICIDVQACQPEDIQQLGENILPEGYLLDQFQEVEHFDEQSPILFRRILVGTDYSAEELEKNKRLVKSALILDFATNNIPFASEHIQMLADANLDFPVFVFADFTLPILEQLVKQPVCGIVLRGGEEEKTGIRQFDGLQDIMEFLEVID